MNRLIISTVALFLSCTSLFCQSDTNIVDCISFNVRYDNPNDGENNWDNRKASVLALLKKYNPSIIGLQELMDHQLTYLKSKLAGYKSFGVGRDDGMKKGEYCSIFVDTSKLSVIKDSTFWLSLSPNIPSKSWDAALNRICTYVLAEHIDSRGRIHVLNVHFDHKGKKARYESAKLIKQFIVDNVPQHDAVVLLGDFNASDKENTIVEILSFLKDPYLTDNIVNELSGTYNGFDRNKELNERIDYIFYSNLEPVSYRHLYHLRTETLFISDHFPVFAQFKLINPN